ncbi:MAG TPA: hypothetical protein VFX59_01555 [Polyangiales bacterium]|nr:hypothetical protein [Polyangiales bacterium]
MASARAWWSALAFCSLLSRAHGQEPAASDCDSERFIVLHGDGVDPALFDEVSTDLATELGHRGIDVCNPDATAREPAALAKLTANDATVVIELDDRITHKRVGRDLPLARVPPNGRALAIAIAIDELLRASWAELTLRRGEAPEDDREDETRVDSYRTRRTVNARGSYHRPPQLTLAAELGYLHAPEHFDAFSLGARFTVRPWQRGWFTLGVAGLASVPAKSSLGDVLASGLRGTLTAGLCARDRRKTFGCGGARVELDYFALRGLDPQMARALVQHAGVVQASAVALLGFPLPHERALFAELAIGGVLVGAEATDGTRVLMAVTGLVLGVNLGLEFEL